MSKWLIVFIIIAVIMAGRSNAQDTCMVTFGTNSELAYQTDEVAVYETPLLNTQIAIAQRHFAYELLRMGNITDDYPRYEIRVDPYTTGWVNGWEMVSARLQGNCSSYVHYLPASDFPGLCTFTLNEKAIAFTNSSLTEIYLHYSNETPVIYEPDDRQMVAENRSAVGLSIARQGESLPGRGDLPVYLVTFTNCPAIFYQPQVTVTVIEDTRLWNMPYVPEGTIKALVPAGSVFYILAGPTIGAINTSGSSEGEWYLLSSDQYGTGWILSDKLQFNGVFPPEPIRTGSVLPGARLWNEPNAQTGQDIGAAPVGANVNLMQGPVTAPINADGTIGEWYYVEVGGRSGWLQTGFIGEPPPTPIPSPTLLPTPTPIVLPLEARGRMIRHADIYEHYGGRGDYTFLPTGTLLEIATVPAYWKLEGEPKETWYYVSTGDISGWILSDNIAFTFQPSTPTFQPTPIPHGDIPMAQGLTTVNTLLLSIPDAQTGEVRQFSDAYANIKIWAGPVSGPIDISGIRMGNWYYVSIGSGEGWLLENDFEIIEVTPTLPPSTKTPVPPVTDFPPRPLSNPTATALPPAVGSATALSGARLWSQPNAQTGEYTGDLEEGAELLILEGPVQGPIRADGSLMGDWYRVATLDGSQAGWVWVGRITIHP